MPPASNNKRIRPTGPGTHDNYTEVDERKGTGLLFAYDIRDDQDGTTINEHNYFVAPQAQPWLSSWDGMRERWYMLKEEATLNMGPYPFSAAYAWRHWLSLAPNPTMLGPTAKEIMRGSIPYLPTHLQNHEGTTIRACADFLFAHGNISTMLSQGRSTMTPLELRELTEDWIMNGRGPLILEARWPDNFMENSGRHIVLKPPYRHPVAVVIRGWSAITDAYCRVTAPFGARWGVHGTKQLASYDLLRLFDAQEDARIVTALDKSVGYEASRLRRIRKLEIEGLETDREMDGPGEETVAAALEDSD